MVEKNYKKKYEFQKKMIERQLDMIESLKAQVDKLKLECEEKDAEIKSINSLKAELTESADKIKGYEKEYKNLVEELRKMRKVINQTVYKGRWWLVKFLIK